MDNLLQLKSLCKIFQSGSIATDALLNIDLEVMPGEFIAVMGPSGCGKTTLMSILAMLDQPTSGEFIWKGKNLAKVSEVELDIARRDNIGVIFQSFNLIDDLTVSQNVGLSLRYKKMKKSDRLEKVLAVLQELSIDHRANHYPSKLSGGQQQRVAIARAVVGDPVMILADEPTGNLDTSNSMAVMELLQNLNSQGTTIIMVTHSEEDAAFAKRIIRLRDGEVVSEVNPDILVV